MGRRRHKERAYAQSVPGMIKKAAFKWVDDRAQRMGAALAFYGVFSMAPLLVIVISLVGAVLGPDAARGAVSDQLGHLMGEENARVLEGAVQRLDRPVQGRWARGVSVLTLLLIATGVLGELRAALNEIWRARPKRGPVLRLLRSRLIALGFLLLLGPVILVTLMVSAVTSGVVKYFDEILPVPGFLLQAANFAVTFAVDALLFALVFKILPDERTAWRDVWVGGAFTAALFSLGNLLLGFYLGRTGVASAYGAAGSLILLILWAYYSAQILYFGAEFTHVYAHTRGSRATRRRRPSLQAAS